MSTVCSSHSVSLVPVIFAQEITELLSPTLQAVFHKTRFLASLSPEIQRYKLASIGHNGESQFLKNHQAGASSLTSRNYGAAVILKKKKKKKSKIRVLKWVIFFRALGPTSKMLKNASFTNRDSNPGLERSTQATLPLCYIGMHFFGFKSAFLHWKTLFDVT